MSQKIHAMQASLFKLVHRYTDKIRVLNEQSSTLLKDTSTRVKSFNVRAEIQACALKLSFKCCCLSNEIQVLATSPAALRDTSDASKSFQSCAEIQVEDTSS